MVARRQLCLAAFAMLCACAVAQQQYVEVLIKWDNTIKQTDNNEKAILEELASELCKVPKSDVSVIKTQDKSTALNTESWGLYACKGANAQAVTKAAQNCGNKKFQSEFKDELEDRTTPDHEAESIVCTVKPGPVPARVQGRRLMAL